ncbi:hypothetical protein PIB30_025718 [Stylosanthes scabra]|uniref:Uncharacterized protein n=1 Tax=Stylosanthes scabra TaxID=79078 RepID=A0ABU6Z8H4_9FABA|nr:hypothetical protein [Stylosanthes scabra]
MAPLVIVDGDVGGSFCACGSGVNAADPSSNAVAASGNQNDYGKEHFVIEEHMESPLKRITAEGLLGSNMCKTKLDAVVKMIEEILNVMGIFLITIGIVSLEQRTRDLKST